MNNHHRHNLGLEDLAAAYDAWADGLYRYALMVLADPAAAEDAMQQAFTKLLAQGPRTAAIERLDLYLRTAVRNECWRIMEQRRRRGGEVELSAAGPLVEPVDSTRADMDERAALEAALRSLPAEQREVIHMKIYEGLTFAQIATATGASLNTAAARYRYGLEKLRTQMARHAGEGSPRHG